MSGMLVSNTPESWFLDARIFNRFIRGATVMKKSGDFYTLRFADGGGIRLRENRLFATKPEAEEKILLRPSEQAERAPRSPHSWNY